VMVRMGSLSSSLVAGTAVALESTATLEAATT
jgi:hypothetical protein